MSRVQPQGYVQGYNRAVTANHVIRTAELEGAFVLPHLAPTFHILDIGCGPGSISAGFAKYVPQGSVTGIDVAQEVIDQANEHLSTQSPQPSNVKFQVANVLQGLPFEDGTFDVAFTSQVMIHIPDPVKAMKEIRRVLKPNGGFVACREADFPFRWIPYLPGIQLFNKYMYEMVLGRTDVPHPDNAPHPPGHRAGSLVPVWAREAGFDPEKMQKGGRMTIYGTAQERREYRDIMVGRIEHGGTREKYLEIGATKEDVDLIVSDFRKWADDPDGWGCIPQIESICRT